MPEFENDIPKHKKKKGSSTSKSKEKSKHQHEYVDCLLVKHGSPHKATYCRLCGKIGDINFFESEHYKDGTFRMLDSDEIFKKYKDLEQICIENIWQKYVPIGKEIK